MDQRQLLQHSYTLARPLKAQGYRFAGLRRIPDTAAHGAETELRLTMRNDADAIELVMGWERGVLQLRETVRLPACVAALEGPQDAYAEPDDREYRPVANAAPGADIEAPVARQGCTPEPKVDSNRTAKQDKPDTSGIGSALTGPRTTAEAVDFLRSALGTAERPASEIREEAERAGFRWRLIQDAASRLGVERRKAGLRGGWVWKLSTEDAREDARGEHDSSGMPITADANERAPCGPEVDMKPDTKLSILSETDAELAERVGVHVGVQQPDALANAVAALTADPSKPYDIRARGGNGRYRLCIAARSISGAIEATAMEVCCSEQTMAEVFRRLGDSARRIEFDRQVGELAPMLGPLAAVAHAAVDVVRVAGRSTSATR